MGQLEELKKMRDLGFTDKEISEKLRSNGYSEEKIKDVLNQEKIKNAISQKPDNNEEDNKLSPSILEEDYQAPKKIPKNDELLGKKKEGGFYYPKSKEIDSNGNHKEQNQQQKEQPQNFFPQENTQEPEEQEFYQPNEFQTSGLDTDTTLEIAEQVFYEKIKPTQKKIEEFEQFRNLSEVKINNFSERLKRIEKIIDSLQTSILEKVGNYGEDINGIKKEMSMIEDSFGKVVNPSLKKTKYSKKRVKRKK